MKIDTKIYLNPLVQLFTKKAWIINDNNEVVAGRNVGEAHCLADEPKVYVVVDTYLGDVYNTPTIFKNKEQALEAALKIANANVNAQKTK